MLVQFGLINVKRNKHSFEVIRKYSGIMFFRLLNQKWIGVMHGSEQILFIMLYFLFLSTVINIYRFVNSHKHFSQR